ncbi:hypothetical protein [Actinomyces wuliandei]|uniref:hypothetical protein n=1 Tax=Actinomyces wuliandei TaxID=2057743 RepID=UPI0013E2E0C2|nr:hypothetical protein [Actinomyces wuliandei]
MLTVLPTSPAGETKGRTWVMAWLRTSALAADGVTLVAAAHVPKSCFLVGART